ncbi:MAG: YqgE/AlgH family protein [Betaproteobacteria bacterium]|jgi:putative transcriptional regulator|uniref:YqgE/AlgH family protein n=1 Tax=Thiomonas sp. FB-6 TaxID=1158291 RepID=UPI00037E3097|nr:YqgE/AlgH family protein [Thiomonas sp. FB-6]MBU6441950.1 YqgE/AlgH family protein [Betaproteobacteria bacterium]MBU6510731.1 YqgE/AlgH family protein [Betaproteobacteria bacterium]MDE2151733.1 YqgE/AlgH family protein [Betaproteobacteria bacterium]MDE2480273.1 YqgE/AlgH family protein [Betaproteobacteria bacterium]
MNPRSDASNLSNQFLIAMPGMVDSSFAGSVIYVCEHSARGALGLVINRPTDIVLKDLFDRIELPLEQPELAARTVYYGGPVQTERGFVLHDPTDRAYASTLQVAGGLQMTTSKDVLEHISASDGPKRFFVALGYSGWSAGQLEDEISRNGWLTVEADSNIVFEVAVEQRFDAAMSLMGISAMSLSNTAGHA